MDTAVDHWLDAYSRAHRHPVNERLHYVCVPAIFVSLLALLVLLPLWTSALLLFAAGWTGQFIGHWHEGARPSFFRDLRFLLICPLWLLARLDRQLGLRY